MKTFQDYFEYYMGEIEGLPMPLREDLTILLNAMESRSGDRLFVGDLGAILKENIPDAALIDADSLRTRALHAMLLLAGWGQPILSTGFVIKGSDGTMHDVEQPIAQEVVDGKMPYTLPTGEVVENFPERALVILTVAEFQTKPEAPQTSQMRI